MSGGVSERRVEDRFPRLETAWRDATLVAGVTTRELDFGGATETPSRATGAARAALREWARGGFRGLIGASQVHGARLFVADGVEVPGDDGSGGPWALRLTGYDGFLTRTPGLLLTATVADCVPAVLWAPDAGAVALLHAGWRGVVAEIATRAIEELAARWGADPGTLRAWWGPAIGPCCYEVGPEVVEAIAGTSAGPAEGWAFEGRRPRVDLRAALTRQGAESGMDARRVAASPRCTSCDRELLHSYRREGGGGGRMMAFAGVPARRS